MGLAFPIMHRSVPQSVSEMGETYHRQDEVEVMVLEDYLSMY